MPSDPVLGSFREEMGMNELLRSKGERGCKGGRRRDWKDGEKGGEDGMNKAVNYIRRIFFR